MDTTHEQAIAMHPVADASASTRAQFIARTYFHLAFAVAAFVAAEVALFQSGLAQQMVNALEGVPWLVILGAFMVVGWLATHMAHAVESKLLQYLALALYVAAEVAIFVPLLHYAQAFAPGAIESAAQTTIAAFLALTLVAFMTRYDFSFLGAFLRYGFLLALMAIPLGIVFGFGLGTWFSIAMVAFAGGAILFDTSNVLHHYPEDRYVGAALELFASLALLFWYVLRLYLAAQE